MSESDLSQLFADHLAAYARQLSELSRTHRVDGLVFGSGEAQYFFEDDQQLPFRADHHFLKTCPVDRPLLYTVFSANHERPTLLYWHQPNHWEETPELPDFITACYDVKEVRSGEQLKKELGALRSYAFVGSETHIGTPATEPLKVILNTWRTQKSAFEVAAVQQANRIALKGHQLAEEAFRAGGTELEIFHAYLKGCTATERDMPYNPIIACDEKGAVLHYQVKRPQRVPGQSLLIDAGYRCWGYASDITRTYARQKDVFHSLIAAIDAMQQNLVESISEVTDFPKYHQHARQGVASILVEHKLVDGSVESCVANKVVDVFFPHGIGHLLGILVHDVGGKRNPPPSDVPQYLRCHLNFQPGMVFTVEPGLYFNTMLLDAAKADATFKDAINWRQVEAMVPFGGIRIEDNIHTRKGNQPQNLTRP